MINRTKNCEWCGAEFTRRRSPGAKARNWPRCCSYTCARLHANPPAPGTAPTVSPTVNDLHWAAGLYEGEGTCGRPRGKGTSVFVNVTQKDPAILLQLARFFGGRVYGPIATNGRFYLHRWQLTGKRAHGFLLTMFPMLSPQRRAQVRVALGFEAIDREPIDQSQPVRPTLADIYWAAGIYEGEGSCQNTGSAVLHVTQKDQYILYRLQGFFGGSVRPRGTRDIHRWILSGRRARGFLFTIFTMLSQRRRAQVRLAVATT